MIKIYEESEEFQRFSKFDTSTGKLVAINEEEYWSYFPKNFEKSRSSLQRIEAPNATLFLGETPTNRTRFPRRIYFQITRNCNLECPACFIKATNGIPHVPTSAINDIAEFVGRNGLMEVRLTGGEPTTHPDIMQIIRKFQEQGVYVSIATNGTFNREIRQALSETEDIWLICSIDGNRNTHNKYRPNTYDKIIENLEYLRNKNPNLRLRLTTVLTKENKDQMFELGCLTKSLGAESITLIPLRPQVRDPKILSKMLSPGEFKDVLDELVRVKEFIGINFTTTIETIYKDQIFPDSVFTKRSSCAAGREGTNLDYDGQKNEFILYGCSYSPASDLFAPQKIRDPFLAGSFPVDQPDRLLDIWRDDTAWEIFRNLSLKSTECLGCSYFLDYQCTGSCPIQNVKYSTLDMDSNVMEQLKRQLQQTGEWYCYNTIFNSIT